MWMWETNGDICWEFLLTASTKTPEREENISPFSFYVQQANYQSHMFALSTS